MNIKLPALSVVAELHGHADDSGFESQFIFDDALSGQFKAAGPYFKEFPDQIKPLSGGYLCAKLDLFDTAKTYKAIFRRKLLFDGKRSQLGRSLDHKYAGEKRPTGDMTPNPKLIIPDVLETDDIAGFRIEMNYTVEMPHFVTLEIDLLNRLDVINNSVQIDGIQVYK